ncbi:MAG: tryptophan synthase subunit alpha [Anaerolineae bacterium]
MSEPIEPGEVVGQARIASAFQRVQREGRAALITYLTMGYPTLDAALDLVPALVRGGADIIELGVPFSDPVADGPTIEAASHAALANGMTPDLCLEQAAALRRQGVDRPLIMMGYYNPILARGLERYVQDCRSAGIDGLIVPDLPPEEAQELRAACDQLGLALIYLAAPTTDERRLQRLARETRGFLYVISRLGTTGGEMQVAEELRAQLALARDGAAPVAVGFGVSCPEHVRALAPLVDGIIVGSAIVRRAPEGPSAVEAFVRELRAAV